MNFWKHIHHRNIIIFVLAIAIAIFLNQSRFFNNLLLNLGSFSFVGAFIAGMLFVSTFTVATSFVMLAALSHSLPPIEIGIIAALGAVIGNLTIFRFVKNDLDKELLLLLKRFDKKQHFSHVFHSKYFAWFLPVVGALIVASPFPDELGVTLMGISEMKTSRFILISFILNVIGIFLVVTTTTFINR